MSMYVCVSVCLGFCPRWYLRNHTSDFYQIFMHVAYGRGSVPSDRVTKSKGMGQFWWYSSHWQCIVQHSIWDHIKTAEPIEMPLEMMTGLGRGVSIPERGRKNFGRKHVPDKPNIRTNCELDWFIPQRAYDRGRRLIASVGRVYYRPQRGNCTARVKSDI